MAKIYVREEDCERIQKIIGSFDLDYSLENDFVENFQIAELDKSNWIVVPSEFRYGKPSFKRSPGRIFYNSAVEEVGKTLEINYKNTSKDSLGREFVGNNNWFNFLRLNQGLGVRTPTLEEQVGYLHLLYLGSKGDVKVSNASGKQVDSKLCEKYLMDIIEVKSPWRAEWLDNNFKTNGKNLEVHYNHIFDKEGKILNYKSEVLDKNTLMEDKQIGVIDFITKNHTSQGHVHKNVGSGRFYSYFPRKDNNFVAWFDAYDDRAGLYCDRDPSDGYDSLGVSSVAD